MTATATEAFVVGLEALVERFRFERDLTYAEAIGCLHMVASELCGEAECERHEGGMEP